MYLKIFVSEKPIYLADQNNNTLQHLINEGHDFYDNNTNLNYNQIVNKLLKTGKKGAVIIDRNLDNLKTDFFKAFKIIEAGGGIVQNEQNEILFIHRLGKWDLPKGKLEKGETIELCAQREVEEETGVTNLSLKTKIGESYHIYQIKEENVLKISHWYHFTCPTLQKTTPQIEEDITEIKWIAPADFDIPLANTYNNIIEITSTFLAKLNT